MSLYQLIRIVVSLAIVVGLFFVLRKKLQQKVLMIGLFVVFVLADVLLCELPIENTFVSFRTPQEAARYVGIDDVSFVIEGQSSGLVISGGQGEYQEKIFPKIADGWGLGGESATHIRTFFSEDSVAGQLVQYKETKEYYIVVIFAGTVDSIEDSLGSTFQTLQVGDGITSDSILVAYIPEYTSQYMLTINDKTVNIP